MKALFSTSASFLVTFVLADRRRRGDQEEKKSPFHAKQYVHG
jgi:hypothetical protein